ncbi:putative copper-exporting P-type ATPase A [uncultured archaeon]|nr:putative copper-exporting P-type ATPase A [uncultured archaeon]
MVKKNYLVKGMHCNSCAHLIETKLKDKVNSISVNYSKETAEIDFDETKITEEEIKKELEKEGYSLNEKSNLKKEESKKSKTGWFILSAAVLLLLVILYITLSKSGFTLPEISIPQFGDNASLILLFAAGLLTGFHCVSMCGGFVVSYTAKNALDGHKSFTQHAIYGGSKVISYTIIGGVFGLIGGFFAFSAGLRGWIAILAGVFMITYAFSMFGIKFFRKFQFNPKFLMRASTNTSSKYKGPYSRPLVTGLLNGLFIACGPLQAMYLYAAGTGNIATGAISLFVFGLGTLPVMLGFGSLATVISHSTTKKILKISAIIVLILGLVMLNRGLTLLGSNYNFDSIKSQITNSGVKIVNGSDSIVLVDGKQVINMDVSASGYSPNSFVLKEGIPVVWNVNVKQLTSCNQELILQQYGIDKSLKEGLNVIEFTPDKEGTLPFSCGMGMLRGSFIVTTDGTATQSQVKASTPKAGSSCSMGANGGGCGCGM